MASLERHRRAPRVLSQQQSPESHTGELAIRGVLCGGLNSESSREDIIKVSVVALSLLLSGLTAQSGEACDLQETKATLAVPVRGVQHGTRCLLE